MATNDDEPRPTSHLTDREDIRAADERLRKLITTRSKSLKLVYHPRELAGPNHRAQQEQVPVLADAPGNVVNTIPRASAVRSEEVFDPQEFTDGAPYWWWNPTEALGRSARARAEQERAETARRRRIASLVLAVVLAATAALAFGITPREPAGAERDGEAS